MLTYRSALILCKLRQNLTFDLVNKCLLDISVSGECLGYKKELNSNPGITLGKVGMFLKKSLTVKYGDFDTEDICVLQKCLKEGMTNSAHVVRESVKETELSSN